MHPALPSKGFVLSCGEIIFRSAFCYLSPLVLKAATPHRFEAYSKAYVSVRMLRFACALILTAALADLCFALRWLRVLRDPVWIGGEMISASPNVQMETSQTR